MSWTKKDRRRHPRKRRVAGKAMMAMPMAVAPPVAITKKQIQIKRLEQADTAFLLWTKLW